MAFLLRRTLLAKCIPSIRYPRYISNHSQLAHALTCEFDTGAPLFSLKGGIVCTGFDPFWAIRRGFAKGRKTTEDESSSATIQVVPDIGPTVKSNTLSLMEAAIAALSRELSKIRTGRASTGMFDHIIVDAHGVKLPLNRVAVVSSVDAHTLSVTPHDPNTLKDIENALVSSPLGINPILGDQRIITPIPPLTKENMQALCKVVSKCAEDGRQSIRRARQKALDTIKKSASSIPKDDVKRLEKEIEEITKHFIKSADEMSRAKEKEVAGS
ncbi:uncharacterized protein LOC110102749 isoform X1 [Dendrobium catenatum]|uniref:uncharacterized protein LOC110102749 isoform X1 n=1 Tax=Dendrobium catenatum TaxID=906689 RepID=UPI0009F6193A|nr:uncharacterized protein LOC110102749 isoform X1 [Dendrobium catenatum]